MWLCKSCNSVVVLTVFLAAFTIHPTPHKIPVLSCKKHIFHAINAPNRPNYTLTNQFNAAFRNILVSNAPISRDKHAHNAARLQLHFWEFCGFCFSRLSSSDVEAPCHAQRKSRVNYWILAVGVQNCTEWHKTARKRSKTPRKWFFGPERKNWLFAAKNELQNAFLSWAAAFLALFSAFYHVLGTFKAPSQRATRAVIHLFGGCAWLLWWWNCWCDVALTVLYTSYLVHYIYIYWSK